jgi:hypothetical protein
MAESILVRLEEPFAPSIAMSDVQVKDPLKTAEAAMKVILIVLMLLIPAWCHADGNELLKRCGLLVSYMDGDSSDISSSGERMFCAGFMQGSNRMHSSVFPNGEYQIATRQE